MPINTPKQRQLQSERIKRTKPWLKTKGPVTPEGKAKVKMNALKTDPILHSLMKDYKALMKQQEEVISLIGL